MEFEKWGLGIEINFIPGLAIGVLKEEGGVLICFLCFGILIEY